MSKILHVNCYRAVEPRSRRMKLTFKDQPFSQSAYIKGEDKDPRKTFLSRSLARGGENPFRLHVPTIIPLFPRKEKGPL